MELIDYNGWENSVRLSNGRIEVVVTTEVGPRVVRCGFCDGANLFASMQAEQGGRGEPSFCLRGGHRFWIAPEDMTLTYEPDNAPVAYAPIAGGVHLRQDVGPISGCQKEMIITMDEDQDRIRIVHRLTNCGDASRQLAPWALSVMAPGGVAVIPLPAKVPHTEAWLHNQLWTVWPYTDFSDGRWTLGKRFILFRQDANLGPAKMGMVQQEGWAAYQLGHDLFVKHFGFDARASYPDGGVNFETFSNQEFLELESLGGLVDLAPGASVTHEEQWVLYNNTQPVVDEATAALLPPAIS
ncbi:MAG: hypothetical protein ACNA71_03650 [Kiritimatiellia bacterium]